MTRQEKAVSLAVLIPLIYGFFIWIETGFFLLPFPLLDLIFFITSIVFGLRLSKTHPYTVLFSIAFALTHLLAQSFIWSMFIPEEQLQQFIAQGNTDLIRLISGCFFICWGGISIYRGENKWRITGFLAFLIAYLAALIFDLNELFIFSIAIPYALSFRFKDIQPFHLLWLLLLLFEWMKWLMKFWIVE